MIFLNDFLENCSNVQIKLTEQIIFKLNEALEEDTDEKIEIIGDFCSSISIIAKFFSERIIEVINIRKIDDFEFSEFKQLFDFYEKIKIFEEKIKRNIKDFNKISSINSKKLENFNEKISFTALNLIRIETERSLLKKIIKKLFNFFFFKN